MHLTNIFLFLSGRFKKKFVFFFRNTQGLKAWGLFESRLMIVIKIMIIIIIFFFCAKLKSSYEREITALKGSNRTSAGALLLQGVE